MTTITDEELQQLLRTAQPYTVALLRWGPKRQVDGVEAITWEHARRMASLRADGLMPIVCPIGFDEDHGAEALAGVGVFSLPLEQAREVIEDDPGVQAGVFVYELHACRSFPGDALPA